MNAPTPLAALEPQSHQQSHQAPHLPLTGHETATAAAMARAKALVSARYEVALHHRRNWDQVRQQILRECRRPSFANDKSAFYRKPVGQGVEGLGIRFVELALRCMGNVEVNTELMYEDERKEVHKCSVVDLEANVPYASDIIVSKTVERSFPEDDGSYFKVRLNSRGRPVYTVGTTDDELLTKRAALHSKALRTVGLRVIPGDIQNEAEWIIKQTRLDDAARDPDAEQRRITDSFGALSVRVVDLEEYLGHPVARCTPAQLVDLRELYVALRDGDVTWKQVMDAKEDREAEKGSGSERTAAPAPAPAAAVVPPRKAKEAATAAVVEDAAPAQAAPAPAQEPVVADAADPTPAGDERAAGEPAAAGPKPGVFMATGGERQNVLVRARTRGEPVEQLLARCGIEGVDATTLDGLTKEQFKQLRAALG